MAFPIYRGCLCPLLHLQHPLHAIPSANSVPTVKFEKENERKKKRRVEEKEIQELCIRSQDQILLEFEIKFCKEVCSASGKRLEGSGGGKGSEEPNIPTFSSLDSR